MKSVCTYTTPLLKLQLQDHEYARIKVEIGTDGPDARWKYLSEYLDHFLTMFLFERKEE